MIYLKMPQVYLPEESMLVILAGYILQSVHFA